MQNADKPPLQFNPKITPAQVKEKLEKKNESNDHSDCPNAPQKACPPAEKKGKQKKEAPKELEKEDKEAVTFPVDSRINAYGFIFLKAKWLAALGWHVDMKIKIERNADSSITVRKA